MNTPETDAALYPMNQVDIVWPEFARKLELERNSIIKKSAELELKCLKIGEVITELNQRLQERQESFQAQLIRIEDIWRGKLAESRKDADRLYNCLLEAQFGEALDIAYVQNVLAQHEELAAIG
jgi:hypothetical protein